MSQLPQADFRLWSEKRYEDLVTCSSQTSAYLQSSGGVINRLTDEARWLECRNALAVASALISKLHPDGPITRRVLLGEKTPQWWGEQADAAKESIVYVRGILQVSVFSWSRAWSEVVVPSAVTTKELAAGAVETSASLVPWLSAAAVALVVGYVLFLTVGFGRR